MDCIGRMGMRPRERERTSHYNLFRYCGNDPLDLTDPMGLAGNDLQNFQMHHSEDRLWDWEKSMESSIAGENAFRNLQTNQMVKTFLNKAYEKYGSELTNVAIPKTFGSYAKLIPYQTADNAPYVNMTLTKRELYDLGQKLGARELVSREAAGMSLVPKEILGRGFVLPDYLKDLRGTIFIAKDAYYKTQDYIHELGNVLSARLTGSLRTFHVNDPRAPGDPDTGATFERTIFHE